MNFEPMTEDHLCEAQALTTSFNWPHTVEDWSFAFDLGSGLVARAGGKVVGTCLTWRLGPGVCTLGLLAVAEETQGQGLGRALLRRALEDQRGRSILLHATHQAIDLYRSEEFAPIGEIRQFQGVVVPARRASIPGDMPALHTWEALEASVAFDILVTLDFEATGIERGPLLRALMPLSEVSVIGPRDRPDGYAFVRPFGRGHVIGPVVAPSQRGARALVSSILDKYADRFVRIDLTEDLTPPDWLCDRGLSEVDRVLAMSNGPMPQGSGRVKRFALIGHAFG